MNESAADTALYAMRDLIASHIACEKECQTLPTGCGCALTAARAVLGVAQTSAWQPMEAHALARLIQDNHDENNPITEYLDAADAILAALSPLCAATSGSTSTVPNERLQDSSGRNETEKSGRPTLAPPIDSPQHPLNRRMKNVV